MNAGVIFDFDGVVIDSEGLWKRAACEILAEFGHTVTAEEYAIGWIANGQGPEAAVEKYKLPMTAAEFRTRRAPIVERLVLNEAELIPGARAALERLSARYPVALATNSVAAIVGPVLDKYDLRRFFKELLTRERYAKAKPEPDAFLAAAAALGLPPARCVVIEDAERGVLAARRAGTKCVAVPNAWTKWLDFSQADRVVSSLDDVTSALIEDLVGGA
jgi:HAD superfamily hydrolase (TIGR01509 family)